MTGVGLLCYDVLRVSTYLSLHSNAGASLSCKGWRGSFDPSETGLMFVILFQQSSAADRMTSDTVGRRAFFFAGAHDGIPARRKNG